MWADGRSAWRFWALMHSSARRGDSDHPIELRVRALAGEPLYVRPGTSDPKVVWETFLGRYHLPPRELLQEDLRSIWDLGSNIGLTVGHLATLFPTARIVGVEMDPDNVRLCRKNVLPWADRCEIVEGAVWSSDGPIRYEISRGVEYGARIVDDTYLEGASTATATALSLNTLLSRQGGAEIDYVKMDVEGAERAILRSNTDWAQSVRCMKVEVHPPYTVEECIEDVRRLGFTAVRDNRHWACVVGTRP